MKRTEDKASYFYFHKTAVIIVRNFAPVITDIIYLIKQLIIDNHLLPTDLLGRHVTVFDFIVVENVVYHTRSNTKYPALSLQNKVT